MAGAKPQRVVIEQKRTMYVDVDSLIDILQENYPDVLDDLMDYVGTDDTTTTISVQ